MPSNVTRFLCEACSDRPLAGGVIKMLWTARDLVEMVERDRADP